MNIILKTFPTFFLGIMFLIVVGGYDGVEENNFRYIKRINDNKGFLIADNFRNKFSGHRRYKRDETALNHRYENFGSNKNCGGIFKSYQTIIYSPNYSPNHYYLPNLICDYRIESPIHCPNEFHIQFLDFQLETSNNCDKDFLIIQNDILCGQIIGIKRYNTTDGILRLRFQTDNKYENKGFKLLITRQPCITDDDRNDYREMKFLDYKGKTNENNIIKGIRISSGKTISGNVIKLNGTAPENIILSPLNDGNIHQNSRHNGNGDKFNSKQYLPPHFAGSNINGYFPPSSYPSGLPNQFPINPTNNNLSPSLICYPVENQKPINFPIQPPQYYPEQFPYFGPKELPQIPPSANAFLNQLTTQYYPDENSYNFINSTLEEPKHIESQVVPWLSQTIPQCCANIFRQKHFYLTSPGFPRFANYPIDCLYYIEKFSLNVCRLRIEFKFFKLGIQTRIGGIEYSNLNAPQVICLEDFIEIDGQRLCGCRTGLVYTSQWGFGAKVIRMRLSGKQIEQNIGFILDILQEDCPYRYQRNPRDIKDSTHIQPNTVVETNSTIRTSVYVQNIGKNSNEIIQKKQQNIDTTEGPNSQFFVVANNQQNRCNFTPIDYFRVTLEPLWISKPVCVARRYTI